jgi:hypothetical protein
MQSGVRVIFRTVVNFKHDILRERFDQFTNWWIYYKNRYPERSVASNRAEG